MGETEAAGPVIGRHAHAGALEILATGRADAVKACAETVLDGFGAVSVLRNRTGLAMLPFEDSVRGTAFHLGEVLVAEAHIRVGEKGVEGYGAVTGRDLEHAMAMAVIDAAIAAGHALEPILALLEAEDDHRKAAERETLRKVEATRVTMETF